MPVYNAGYFLVDALDSIVNQTYKNFEVIIIDDASRDGSANIITWYKKRYPKKIRFIKLKRNANRGGDACANIGFARAKGKYIARMDADDIADQRRLEKQVAYLEKHNDVILLGTQAYVINKNGQIIGEKNEPTDHETIKRNYFIYHPIIHPSVMIRKNMLPHTRYLYKIQYSANNDLLTFFKLLSYGKFANLPEKLMCYRIHGHNDSLVNPKEKFMNTLKIRFYAWKHFGHEPDFQAVLVNILQFAVVMTMPSSVITFLYMFWRGVAKPHFSFLNFRLTADYS